MQPVVLPPVVNVSNLWDVCVATCTRLNWSGFMQTVCVGEHESPSQINVLPINIIDLNPSDGTCVYLTLVFV